MNKFLELQSKYAALIDRNNATTEIIGEKLKTAIEYERLRLLTEQVRLQIANLDYADFIRELQALERQYEGSD